LKCIAIRIIFQAAAQNPRFHEEVVII